MFKRNCATATASESSMANVNVEAEFQGTSALTFEMLDLNFTRDVNILRQTSLDCVAKSHSPKPPDYQRECTKHPKATYELNSHTHQNEEKAQHRPKIKLTTVDPNLPQNELNIEQHNTATNKLAIENAFRWTMEFRTSNRASHATDVGI